ncbi:hypothetical protein HNV11_09820 [Spirosoma taeanense]|uniref:Uncharacterized protein n=1 Tax=Spirosoma taeanense TaxID=2735870 RepID=A0A6M5Y380_9BACT|nr:hypothetical protein [Spirosoma taeanense]QJW87864.1 hypothetical protein HNV11_09820 [Spirosoma taeanense]
MESDAGQEYHGKQEAETEGLGYLVKEKTEDVDASGVDDESDGMGNDDYLGRTHKENSNEDD